MISKMPPDEVDYLFKTHADFVANICTLLPLALLVQNIDRIRDKHNQNQTTIERSTREWAESLVDENGRSLQCDVENGSNNRAVQLLVPKDDMPRASSALRVYKERISPFNQLEIDFVGKVNLAHPATIYVPTPTVQNNLTFLQNLSPSMVWSNAPASVWSPNPSSTPTPNQCKAPKFGL